MSTRPDVTRLAARAFAVLLLPIALFAAACGDDDPVSNADVTVEIVHSFEAAAAPTGGVRLLHETPRTFTTDQGFEVTLTKAYLVMSVVEIHAEGHGAVAPGSDGIRPATSPTFPGVHAPIVEALLEHDLEPVLMGNFQVAPGHYHGMTVTLAPADAEAANLPDSVDMMGRTLYLAGTATRGAFSDDFVISWDGTADVPVHFAAGDAHGKGALRTATAAAAADEALLELRGGTATTIRIGKTCHEWLDGVNFETMGDTERRGVVVANVQASLHHHVGEIHEEE